MSDRKCPKCGTDLDITAKTRLRLDGKPIDRLTATCKACSFDGPAESVFAWRGLQLASRTPEEKKTIDESWRAYLKQVRAIEEGTVKRDDECAASA